MNYFKKMQAALELAKQGTKNEAVLTLTTAQLYRQKWAGQTPAEVAEEIKLKYGQEVPA